MRIFILNGPNLNLLGQRETNVYGTDSFEYYFEKLKNLFPDHSLEFRQSNVEGELINMLHEQGFTVDGIILNAGGYTHTSVALADAVAAIRTPVIEVHISNVYSREDYRHVSLMAKNCLGVIAGFGLDSYKLAIEAFLMKNNLK